MRNWAGRERGTQLMRDGVGCGCTGRMVWVFMVQLATSQGCEGGCAAVLLLLECKSVFMRMHQPRVLGAEGTLAYLMRAAAKVYTSVMSLV
jgi:hypothetical protein